MLVKCEQLGRLDAAVMFKTWLSRVKAVERAHEWTKFNAKAIDHLHRTGSEECDLWARM